MSGWGRYPRSVARVYRPEKRSHLSELLTRRPEDSYLTRGLGRSYGDAALNRGGGIILSRPFNRFLQFDRESGLLACEGGVSLEEIIEVCLPQGWFLPVTPGTKFATIGGAVACDVHGKNHHRDGTISRHIEWIEVLLADGTAKRCSTAEDSDLFRATVGGMGLTGIILAVGLRMRKVETAYVRVDYRRTRDLEETLLYLEEEDRNYTYSVAWVDCLARGARMGRGVLMGGNPASPQDLTGRQARDPLLVRNSHLFSLPVDLPGFVVGPASIRLFNSLYYRRFRRGKSSTVEHYDPFFYPLDKLGSWNRAYGKSGFLQYQFVLPPESARRGLRKVMEVLSDSGKGSFLAVLKRFGPDDGLICFPQAGYTLALDFAMRGASTLELLASLDGLVMDHGGRVYLAKDARLSGDHFRQMYPGFDEWLRLKEAFDPEGVFASDLSRRLGWEVRRT